MDTVTTRYIPQPKQALLHKSPANEILYGGSAGPGKSHALRHEALAWCMRVPGLQVYLFRRTFPELEKNHILPSREEFPGRLGTYLEQKRRWVFHNGSMIHFSHCQHESDVFNYQGAEIHLLVMDELTTFNEFMYDYLRGRVRCTLDVPEKYRHKIPGIVCASNPGGIGHEFVKERWVDFGDQYEVKKAPDKEGGMLRQYIPGLLEDNLILMQTDPNYKHRLDALPEPYRTAYRDGDWDIFMGQAFNFSRKHHVIDPIPIPEGAPLYSTFDWGFGKPFSQHWYWVDSDGRVFMFAEWYGWNGEKDQGMRLTDSEIAEGIIEREKTMGIADKKIIRLAGHDSWNRKPDYKGGGQGKSTAEVFAEYKLYLSPADPNRELKIRQFRERLRIWEKEAPMLQVYSNCEHTIRTIPQLQMSTLNVEDVDSTGEDHCYDSICQICMARPITPEGEKPPLIIPETEARIRKLYGEGRDTSLEQDLIESDRDFGLWNEEGIEDAEDMDGWVSTVANYD